MTQDFTINIYIDVYNGSVWFEMFTMEVFGLSEENVSSSIQLKQNKKSNKSTDKLVQDLLMIKEFESVYIRPAMVHNGGN